MTAAAAPSHTHRSADPRLLAQVRHPRPWPGAVLAALLGWVALGVALGLSVGIVDAVTRAFGADRVLPAVLQAVLMSALAVPAVVVLRRRMDRRSLRSMGLARRVGRPLALGAGVGAVTGALVWMPAGALGWIRVDDVDLLGFVGFLLLNGVVLALYEAIPEELALRGHVWTNLRDGLGLVAATILTTALFPLIGVVVSPVRALVAVVRGGDPLPFAVFPAGMDPIVYVVQLALFGLALVAARRIPVEGALLVAVAFHWTQLTVTRLVFGGTGWAPSGWDVAFVEPDAIALVLVHIVLAGLVFVAVRVALQARGRGRAAAGARLGTGEPR
ncbi:CPBP family intramembrane metalloprotease [Clavibacter capsici]|uniref:CPBP family glutamic-type intramembrane protease n=1 Tax=Clavibacter capsici TaxID=1874630 RepID=UPI001427FB98|nr:CPBP family glutamic-type intramembrane protease [Clavibacter capsici]QIS42667.1 CPBP family intramembrane metalloprotease [Clavibacter capsici]